MKPKIVLHAILALLIWGSCNSQEVTLESLLYEMTDREALTRLPEYPYTLKQFSSYDRESKTPGGPGWYANDDYTRFLREENNGGRRELVLFDAQGPGAVVRWWMTFAGEGAADGTLRIYIDDQPQPVVEGNVLEILSGEVLASGPLAASVSPETEYKMRGHNLYLPLPYAGKCRITYECDAVRYEDNRWQPSIYYNICYRTYNSDVTVKSVSSDVLKRNSELISATAQLLDAGFTRRPERTMSDQKTLAPGDSLSLYFDGAGRAVQWISAKLESSNLPQALRSTVLSIAFDDQQTVWVPAGDFFGTGYQLYPSKTWYTSVTDDGLMESYWLMPFKKTVSIKFINHGKEEVTVDAGAGLIHYTWDKSSLYFGGGWHEFYNIYTAEPPSAEGNEWHFDVNYVDLKGQGVYAGDALTLFNTANGWWGEGDEKIFVDGESFPSFIGTGTEDYYGYAWCRPENFTHPFIAQPTGAGNLNPGMSVNMRYRTLDAIPFNRSLSSNIELWHWLKTTMNFAMSSYWYALPGFQSNRKPDVEAVQKQVILNRSEIYPPVANEKGILEGENLEVVNTPSGTAGPQGGDYGWSENNQLWWRQGEKGDKLILQFMVEEEDDYNLSAVLTKAPDYGIIQLYLDDRPVGTSFNGYNKEAVITQKVNLGSHRLTKGDHKLSVEILGADPEARPGNMAGIDRLEFKK